MTSQDISPERRLPEQPPSGETAPAPAPFADPGPPPHRPRRQDIDERAAKRSERTVALLFTIATVTAANPNVFSGANTSLPSQIFTNASSSFAGAQARGWGAALTLIVIAFILMITARFVTARFARFSR